MNSGIDKRVATHTSHIILEDLSRLPIGTEPTYLAEGMVGLCTVRLFESGVLRRHGRDTAPAVRVAARQERRFFHAVFQGGPGAFHGYHERCMPDDARFLLLYAETFLFPFYGKRSAAL